MEKRFGLIMILSVIGHLSFNFKSILMYVRNKWIAVFGGVMVAHLVVLYGVALNNEVAPEIAIPMDKLAAETESYD